MSPGTKYLDTDENNNSSNLMLKQGRGGEKDSKTVVVLYESVGANITNSWINHLTKGKC